MSMNDQTWQSEEEQFAAADAPQQPAAPEQVQQPEQQAPAEPFEGFGLLPESVRQRYAEWDQGRTKSEAELAQARREISALKGKVPYLERELSQFRKAKPAATASPADKPVSAEAWEAYKAQFPDDAKAIEQFHARQAAEIGGKLDPLAQELKELREWREQVQRQMDEAQGLEIQETLAESVPDWKVIAGWETPDGSPGDGQWHPEFSAWLDSLPDRMRGMYEEALSGKDAGDIAYVLNAFKRDYQLALIEEGQQMPAPAASQRQKALRDVTPAGGANGIADRPKVAGYMSEEDRFAAAVSMYQDRWAG